MMGAITIQREVNRLVSKYKVYSIKRYVRRTKYIEVWDYDRVVIMQWTAIPQCLVNLEDTQIT
jgi:hypothetical protein